MEARHLKGKANLLSVSAAGLWMRQDDGAGQSVIHVERLSADSVTFSKVIIFLFREGDQFDRRIDAEEARLAPGNWQLKNVLVTRPGRLAERYEKYTLPTSLTMAQILDSFAPPETLSFWSLAQFIDSLEAAGFSAVRHRLYWHNMLATPFLLCAMILLAATFSLRHSRFGGTGVLLGFGVLAGFIFYFLSDVVSAFALAGSLPVTLAAWAPSTICALVGLAIMFQMEDG